MRYEHAVWTRRRGRVMTLFGSKEEDATVTWQIEQARMEADHWLRYARGMKQLAMRERHKRFLAETKWRVAIQGQRKKCRAAYRLF
jgi:hypothetical protein